MKHYSSFIFDSYDFDPSTGVAELHYSLDDEVKFTETLTLPPTNIDDAKKEDVDRVLFALHVIGGVSYYKTCLPKTIEIRSGTLSPEQVAFWNTVYENGLGEFFYKNDIDFRGLVDFHPHPPSPSPSTFGAGRGGVNAKERILREYRPSVMRFARQLRQDQTEAEDILWETLRDHRFHGLHFRRQHPIDRYVLDFFCHTAGLGIELDGPIHDENDQQEKDTERTHYMREAAIRIIRFRNEDVQENLPWVLSEIEKETGIHSPLPPRVERAVGEGLGVGVFSGKKILVPIGGGKDSLVTIELLRQQNANITLFRMGGHPLIDELAKIAGYPLLTIKRSLSPELFKLNEEGALNGHVPITAYLSFVTVLIALLYDFDAIAMSNEKSADEGNVESQGKMINHQWSKSEEFERAFQDYVASFITNHVQYRSMLRSMTECEITKIFSQHPKYFQHFTSCNANWKILSKGEKVSRWCGKCPKCAFSFVLMAAFLPEDQLVNIFGRNFFNDESLVPLYRQLLGLEGIKPFECVGTPEETKAAFRLAQKKAEHADTPVMHMFSTVA